MHSAPHSNGSGQGGRHNFSFFAATAGLVLLLTGAASVPTAAAAVAVGTPPPRHASVAVEHHSAANSISSASTPPHVEPLGARGCKPATQEKIGRCAVTLTMCYELRPRSQWVYYASACADGFCSDMKVKGMVHASEAEAAMRARRGLAKMEPTCRARENGADVRV